MRHYLAKSHRLFERNQRHRHGLFIQYHNVEVDYIDPHKLREMYARVPAWYSEIETTYGFHYGSAATLQYASSALQFISTGTRQEFMLWSRLRTETVAQIIEHLVYEARAGRLFWIPYPVRQDARTLELHSLSFTDTPYSKEVCKKFEKLLNTIDRISWKELPTWNKIPGFPDTGVIAGRRSLQRLDSLLQSLRTQSGFCLMQRCGSIISLRCTGYSQTPLAKSLLSIRVNVASMTRRLSRITDDRLSHWTQQW